MRDLGGELWIPHFAGVKVDEVNPNAVLDFALAPIGQVAGPFAQLAEDIGNRFRKQDVPGIAAVHDALRQIDAPAGDVAVGVDVGDPVDGTGVNAHAQLKLRTSFEDA